jgi:hypothetical protein
MCSYNGLPKSSGADEVSGELWWHSSYLQIFFVDNLIDIYFNLAISQVQGSSMDILTNVLSQDMQVVT